MNTNNNRSGEPRLASIASWAVLTASFGLSATTWVALAVLAGFTSKLTIPLQDTSVTLALAWLMPVAVDGYVVVALVLWMAPVPQKVAAFAKYNTYGAASVGIAAQSAYHLLSTLATTNEMWRVVLAAIVGALPPTVAGLAVHMRALIRREGNNTNTNPSQTMAQPAVSQPAVPPVSYQPSPVANMATRAVPPSIPDLPVIAAPMPSIPSVATSSETPATVASRITRRPTTTEPIPAPMPAAALRPSAARHSSLKPTAPRLTPSSTDIPVTGKDAVQPRLPLVPAGLLQRATELARQYRTDNSARITPGQLAVRMRVTTDQAAQLLAVIDDTPTHATTVNGSPVKAA